MRQMQTQLVKTIYSFIRYDIKFSLRRLLKADTKHLYIGKNSGDLILTPDLKKAFSDGSKQCDQYRVHPIKGGLQLRSYLTYNWYLFLFIQLFIEFKFYSNEYIF